MERRGFYRGDSGAGSSSRGQGWVEATGVEHTSLLEGSEL